MDELEGRVLRRLLKICNKKDLIGPHRFDDDIVHIVVDSKPQALTHHEAFRYLLDLLEEANLADEFYDVPSAHARLRRLRA